MPREQELSANYTGFLIRWPESVCRLMIPALKASGRWSWNDHHHTPIDETECNQTTTPWILYHLTKLNS